MLPRGKIEYRAGGESRGPGVCCLICRETHAGVKAALSIWLLSSDGFISDYDGLNGTMLQERSKNHVN